MDSDGLKKYNTGTYVPERTEAGTSSGLSAERAGGNADGGAGTQNAAKSPGEAQEGVSEAKDVSMSGLGAKGSGRGRKWLVWVVLGVILVALAGVGIWMVIGRQSAEPGVGEGPGDTAMADKEPEGRDVVTELALDDELVQRLYGEFDRVGLSMSGTIDFYADGSDGDLDKSMMIAVAMPSVAGESNTPCRGEYDGMIGPGCYDGETIRQRIKHIFGEDVSFEDGDRNGNMTCRWEYSEKNDEFYGLVGCGGTCLYGLGRILDRAERDSDRLYLYETAYGETCQGLYHVNGDVIAEVEFDADGNLVSGYVFDDYKDQLDKFKWTFVKNTEGNYIFEKLEKLN